MNCPVLTVIFRIVLFLLLFIPKGRARAALKHCYKNWSHWLGTVSLNKIYVTQCRGVMTKVTPCSHIFIQCGLVFYWGTKSWSSLEVEHSFLKVDVIQKCLPSSSKFVIWLISPSFIYFTKNKKHWHQYMQYIYKVPTGVSICHKWLLQRLLESWNLLTTLPMSCCDHCVIWARFGHVNNDIIHRHTLT